MDPKEEIVRKQAYLRDHISADMHEDFGQFCESYAGNLDIEKWSFTYVKELVKAFHESRNKQTSPSGKESFHLYQTGNALQIKQISQQIKDSQDAQRQVSEHSTVTKEKNSQERQQDKAKSATEPIKEEMNALQFLDSVFEKKEEIGKPQLKYDKSFFQSNNFWKVPGEDTKRESFEKQQTQTLVLEPDQFEKVFQSGTGLEISKPEPQTQTVQKVEKVDLFKKQKTLNYDELTKVLEAAEKGRIGFEPVKNNIEEKKEAPKGELEPIKSITVGKGKSSPQAKKSVQVRNSPLNIKEQADDVPKKQIKLISITRLEEINPRKNIALDGPPVFKEKFKELVPCFQAVERWAVSNKDLSVSLTNHEIVQRQFFSSNYVMYWLKVLPNNITCKRNLEDFTKLRTHLSSVYPGMRLPYLEKSGGWLENETDPHNIEQQKKNLAYFIRDILQNPQLRNSRLVQDFLTLKEHKQIKRKFEEYEKIKKVTAIEELCLLGGKVEVELSQEKRIYATAMEKFLASMEEYFYQHRKLCDEIHSYHKSLVNSYEALTSLIEGMKKTVLEFNQGVYSDEIRGLSSALGRMADMNREIGRLHAFESKILEATSIPVIKYEKENMHTLYDILFARNDLTKQYLKRRDNQKAQSYDLYLDSSLKPSKVDVLEESKNIVVLKYQCGYLNSSFCKEAHSYFQGLGDKLRKLLSQVSLARLERDGKSAIVWEGLSGRHKPNE